MIRIDLDGKVLEGDWPAPLGIPLHLELHKARPGRRGGACTTTRAGARCGPTCAGAADPRPDSRPAAAATSCWSTSTTATSATPTRRRSAVAKMGEADLALLAHHGVFVLGNNVNAVYWRAASFEWRCRNAWLVEQGGGGPGVPQVVHDTFGRSDGTRFRRLLGDRGPPRAAPRSRPRRAHRDGCFHFLTNGYTPRLTRRRPAPGGAGRLRDRVGAGVVSR